MEKNMKVFSSEITRGQQKEISGLYELINITPAKPISSLNIKESYSCKFQPRTDKHYEPKKNNKHKVKTVRDIRSLFEKDVYHYLSDDLEKQQKVLLRKIRTGSSKDPSTIQLAKDIFNSDNPISRSSWQMLVNINPEKHAHPTQYILWNGKCIQVNGSKGGRYKFIYNYDLGRNKESLKPNAGIKKTINKKKRLLQNSLTVKFKPGPLRLKKYLDDSYQKYHVGSTELVNLPKPGLDIQPSYGCSVEPTITNFLNSLRDVDGLISKKWAEFSVSVLGTLKNSNPVQHEENSVIFDLSYKYDQHRILMRRDIDNCNNLRDQNKFKSQTRIKNLNDILPDVKTVVERILDTVEISLTQDNMYTGIETPRSASPVIISSNTKNFLSKDKTKRKYGELDRLDVTIITLPENSEQFTSQTCLNSYCTLGCICASLKCPLIFKNHCGRIDCMFECKCDFSKYKITDTFDSDYPEFLPGLINLDNAMSLNLAKEEQKFHQTVVFTGEKSILLKSRKRNWKTSKKYADFYSSMCLKTETKKEPILFIVDMKLNCENIQPWCMVHNLYKCFCKGKITSSSYLLAASHDTHITESIVSKDKETSHIHNSLQSNLSNCHQPNLNNITRPRLRSERIKNIEETQRLSKDSNCENNSVTSNSNEILYSYDSCARVNPYNGRKFSNGYYKNANHKIFELEKNDLNLSKKLLNLCIQSETSNNYNVCMTSNKTSIEDTIIICDTRPSEKNRDKLSSDDLSENNVLPSSVRSRVDSTMNKSKLIAWLEYSYKQYKKRAEQGIVSTTLQAPKPNKIVLHPWEFILSRYRERKNHFLISKQQPYRIFMAVDTKHPFFLECINIDDIRFADLHKYPITIKNLLTNATDLKDNFCILCGLSLCWELVGSVTKMSETSNNSAEGETNQSILSCDNSELLKYLDDSNNSSSKMSEPTTPDKDKTEFELLHKNTTSPNISNSTNFENSNSTPESSKWFVMTVENDFSEIQFFNRGFFVKYESIIRAISIARKANQTVRLSSQKCTDKNSNPQFGIYAVPYTNEYCVFVGPYEPNEPLGVETVKTVSDVPKPKRTRGFWITTDKIDNFKVIDNPLSFMPDNISIDKKIVPLESDAYRDDRPKINIDNSIEAADTNKLELDSFMKGQRIIKPIKIKKEQLLKSVSLLNKVIPQNNVLDAKKTSLLGNNCLVINTSPNVPTLRSLLSINLPVDVNTCSESTISAVNDKTDAILMEDSMLSELNDHETVATNDPLPIQISEVYSEFNKPSEKRNVTSDVGMLILKPEEINERIMNNIKMSKPPDSIDADEEINKDIFKFLSSNVRNDKDDVFIISDDEEEDNAKYNSNINDCKEVWIECENILTVGWIVAKRNSKKFLSFKIPGLNFSEFYVQDVAFSKINKVLSQTVNIPEHMKLKWRVVDSKSELKTDHQLNFEYLQHNIWKTKEPNISSDIRKVFKEEKETGLY